MVHFLFCQQSPSQHISTIIEQFHYERDALNTKVNLWRHERHVLPEPGRARRAAAGSGSAVDREGGRESGKW